MRPVEVLKDLSQKTGLPLSKVAELYWQVNADLKLLPSYLSIIYGNLGGEII